MNANTEFNYSKLKGKMAEQGYTAKSLAKIAGITPTTFSIKLNGCSEFKQNEMISILNALGVSLSEVGQYFFCSKSSV